MSFKTCCIILSCCLIHGKLFCQVDFSNDNFITKAVENTEAAYHKAMGINAGVYNGIFYPGYDFKFTDGLPYFYSNELSNGWVVYDGVRYDSVLLQYDEVIDELIAANSTGKMRLWTPRVTAFSIFDAVFVALKKDEKKDSTEKAQFYQLLYKGKMMVLEKEQKEIKEIISGVDLQRFIVTRNSHYILKNGVWHTISSKKDFYKMVSDHKDEVKAFIKEKNLNFRKDKSNTLAQSVAYYEKLK